MFSASEGCFVKVTGAERGDHRVLGELWDQNIICDRITFGRRSVGPVLLRTAGSLRVQRQAIDHFLHAVAATWHPFIQNTTKRRFVLSVHRYGKPRKAAPRSRGGATFG